MPASIERRVDKLFSLVFLKSNTVKVQEEIGKGIFGVGIIFFIMQLSEHKRLK